MQPRNIFLGMRARLLFEALKSQRRRLVVILLNSFIFVFLFLHSCEVVKRGGESSVWGKSNIICLSLG